jgi:hypothetical protein
MMKKVYRSIMIRYLLIIFIGGVVFTGCNVINPPEPVPTYVHVDSFKFLNSDPVNNGSPSHAINTVFANYNGINIGAFDLPCNIPVITTPGAQLILSPGIEVNGYSNQESPYPFYLNDVDTLKAQPGKIVNYTPVTGYNGNISLLVNNPFETNTQFTILSGAVSMILTNDGFEGKAGYVNFLTNDSAQYATVTGFLYNATRGSRAVICELNYKSNIPIAVGLIPYSTGSGTTYTIPPQYNNQAFAPAAQWTKLYISLTEIISLYPADAYQLVIKAAVPYGQASGYALFDNLKVVTTKY